jgi:hypothetical protein
LQWCASEIRQPGTNEVFMIRWHSDEAQHIRIFTDMSLNTLASYTLVTLAYHGSCQLVGGSVFTRGAIIWCAIATGRLSGPSCCSDAMNDRFGRVPFSNRRPTKTRDVVLWDSRRKQRALSMPIVSLIKDKDGILVVCKQLLVEEYNVTSRLSRRDA